MRLRGARPARAGRVLHRRQCVRPPRHPARTARTRSSERRVARSRSPRKGYGLAERFGYLTETPSRVVATSPPLQTAGEGEQHMAAALAIQSQPAKTRTHDDGLSAFMSVRPRLFGIAYRMLDSAAEAEDVVQDVWIRWQTADRSVVRDAAAFLATTTTRLAINVMHSARSRRETYVGPWLPEPVDTSADPGLGAERGEALELAILVLLEKLSATERAAYILREAFDYAYRDIANVLRLGEANARQVVTRARQHVANGRRMSGEFDRAKTSSRRFHRRGPEWRRRRPRRSLCVGRRLDLGRRRMGARRLIRHNASPYPVNGS